MRILCRLTDIPDNGAKGFPGPEGSFTGLVAVRQGGDLFLYENACPHIGTPLDWTPDRFLSADGTKLVCATHGALFQIPTGLCVFGPCLGDHLTPTTFCVRDGLVLVAP